MHQLPLKSTDRQIILGKAEEKYRWSVKAGICRYPFEIPLPEGLNRWSVKRCYLQVPF